MYEADFSKHTSTNELPRIRMVWNSIPMQLAKENKKFFFGKIKEGARAKDFEIAIEWLLDCGLIKKVYNVSKPAMPLKAYTEFTPYYFSETKSEGEIDFLIQKGTDIVPIEVKAEENLKAKSLRVYCNKFKPKMAIRTSMSNYREQDWMVNVPLYVLDKYLDRE